MLPQTPSWIWGRVAAGGGVGLGRGGKAEGKEGPKLLLNQGPSEACYATGNTAFTFCGCVATSSVVSGCISAVGDGVLPASRSTMWSDWTAASSMRGDEAVTKTSATTLAAVTASSSSKAVCAARRWYDGRSRSMRRASPTVNDSRDGVEWTVTAELTALGLSGLAFST